MGITSYITLYRDDTPSSYPMTLSPSDKAQDIIKKVKVFYNENVLPNEEKYIVSVN